MSSHLGEDLNHNRERELDEASTAVPTPLYRSTTTSVHSKEGMEEKEAHDDPETKGKTRSTAASSNSSVHDVEKPVEPQDGAPLEPVESSMYPSSKKVVPIMFALCLTMFLVALDMTIVATAIPRITDQFQSLDDVGWYGSAFFLTVAAFQSTWGKAYK
jgi:hypothetical protein